MNSFNVRLIDDDPLSSFQGRSSSASSFHASLHVFKLSQPVLFFASNTYGCHNCYWQKVSRIDLELRAVETV